MTFINPRFFKPLKAFYQSAEARSRKHLVGENELIHRHEEFSRISGQFIFILAMAASIGALGLMADSTVTIVGAMLIAPLMRPIVAIAFGLVKSDLELKLHGLGTLAIGVLLSISIGFLIETMLGLESLTNEILARTKPNLIDLGVAIAAGVAVAVAVTREDVADALPGVAIAVALVPPLCVAGICLSLNQRSLALGAMLLFAINLVAIIFSAALVYLMSGYGSWRLSVSSLSVVAVVLALLAWPLSTALLTIKLDDRAQVVVVDWLNDPYFSEASVSSNDLDEVSVMLFDEHVRVDVKLRSPLNTVTEVQLAQLNAQLSEQLERDVHLVVEVELIQQFNIGQSAYDTEERDRLDRNPGRL